LVALVACGGSSASTGAGGSAGAVASGTGGTSGATGSGGSVATGGAEGGLPACAVAVKPADPDAGVCNSIAITGATLMAESIVGTDTGISVDGGIEVPMGGTIIDGDYDMVRWQDIVVGAKTRRTMRVFGGGSYIEWAGVNLSATPDAGDYDFRYNSTAHVTGTSLVVDRENCTDGPPADDFGFTVNGDEIALFNGVGVSVVAVDTYRRTCTRP
jgi:hypothetical protein